MNFDEYEQQDHLLYQDLVDTVQDILKSALARQDDLHAFLITGRAKTPASLLKKLHDRGIDPTQPIEGLIKDFAGCRVVFLTNSEMNAFDQIGILRDNFNVIDVDIHHPVPGTKTEDQLFDSNNFLVELKPEQLAQEQFRKFAGMRCEIQVQTLLNRAWSEMSHPIYKKPELADGLGQKYLKRINERMNKVMRDHLIPAGHDFDKIARDYERLIKANAAADEARGKLCEAPDNNICHDALEAMDDLVIPMFDNLHEQFAHLVPDLVLAVEKARAVPTKPIETMFGNFDGKSALDIAKKVGSMLTDYRYYSDSQPLLEGVLQLYSGATDTKEKAIWIEFGEKLAEHNLLVWKTHGPALQALILEFIVKLKPEESRAARDFLVPMLEAILSAEVSGTTSTFDSVTIHQGSVQPSIALDKIRSDAMKLLGQYLDEVTTDATRKPILQALRKAGQNPHLGRYGDDIAIMVMRDGAIAANMIVRGADKYGLGLKHWCESQAHHWHYAVRDLRPDLKDKPEAVKAQQAVVSALIALRDSFNADPEYVLFKTLVGHDSVRPEAWEGIAFDYEATGQWRKAQFPNIIESITVEAVPEWLKRLRQYLDLSTNDGAQYIALDDFLKALATSKPDVGIALLDGFEEELGRFVPSILKGLHTAGSNAIIERIARWVADGRFVLWLSFYYDDPATFELENVVAIMGNAMQTGNDRAVMQCMDIALRMFTEKPDGLIKRVFMPGVDFFAARRNDRWVNAVWLGGAKPALINELETADAQKVLNSFETIDRIEYQATCVMAALGARYPELIIDFFGKRMQHDRTESKEYFEAIPYHLHSLPSVLSGHVRQLLDTASRWYAREPLYHQFGGGRLMSLIFPGLPNELLEAYGALVHAGNEQDIKFILSSLRCYEGNERIYALCMNIVDKLQEDSPLLESVASVLQVTGVLRGEFGYVEAHMAQKARLEPSLQDSREKVKEFASKQISELEKSMAWEQRRAELGLETRRREWD
ncbi:MAG: hypothetical protein ACK502_09630 [Alphaproteobacteria bacterium]